MVPSPNPNPVIFRGGKNPTASLPEDYKLCQCSSCHFLLLLSTSSEEVSKKINKGLWSHIAPHKHCHRMIRKCLEVFCISWWFWIVVHAHMQTYIVNIYGKTETRFDMLGCFQEWIEQWISLWYPAIKFLTILPFSQWLYLYRFWKY